VCGTKPDISVLPIGDPRKGRILIAGLDVLEIEPQMCDKPILERDDVVPTPHTGAYIRTAFDRIAVTCAESVEAVQHQVTLGTQ